MDALGLVGVGGSADGYLTSRTGRAVREGGLWRVLCLTDAKVTPGLLSHEWGPDGEDPVTDLPAHAIEIPPLPEQKALAEHAVLPARLDHIDVTAAGKLSAHPDDERVALDADLEIGGLGTRNVKLDHELTAGPVDVVGEWSRAHLASLDASEVHELFLPQGPQLPQGVAARYHHAASLCSCSQTS
jgi:hypothetical protein